MRKMLRLYFRMSNKLHLWRLFQSERYLRAYLEVIIWDACDQRHQPLSARSHLATCERHQPLSATDLNLPRASVIIC